ncbi:ABC transporter permease subunit [Opitutia bacterium ISCC 51]|nr:ABC transporter permease subunit [Opitutae bacterium ISCC 51]QXD27087.1 ABC transporter permease subunit [Opitutae bacterium ISCC 52]
MKHKYQAFKVPKRFRVQSKTLWFDHFMNYFIVVGGAAVIAAVLGIFVFIFMQILPLFRGANLRPLAEYKVTEKTEDLHAFDMDEWAELPVVIHKDGTLRYVDISGDRGTIEYAAVFGENQTIAALSYNSLKRILVASNDSGQFAFANLGYRSEFDEQGNRTIHPVIEASDWYPLAADGESIQAIDYGDGDSNKMAAAICEDESGNKRIRVATLNQRRSLFGGGGEISIGLTFELSEAIQAEVKSIDVSPNGDLLLITANDGELILFVYEDGGLEQRQRFHPFSAGQDTTLAKAEFLLGDTSLSIVGSNGENVIHSLSLDSGLGKRVFSKTKEMKPLPGEVIHYYPGVRNKSFLLTTQHHASLRYSTTEDIRWKEDFDFEITEGIIGEKYDRIALLDTAGMLHVFLLDDPHPQAGFNAFFGKIHYEGQAQADYVWQSTGGTDDFEPKLSLIPLIIGTLKGTFYAMLFAIPIALLAALYTSQFLDPKLRDFVKPTMEIMASLPSVVLGFVAALWLAPLVDTRIPSLMLIVLVVPTATLIFAWFWSKLPKQFRLRIPSGLEFIILTPILLIVCYFCWNLGPVFERIFFIVTNPTTGERVADFRLWWPEFTGATYTQRNSLIVGFMIGFAVIPIIFTIAEDAMSNVPPAIRSGSLALGASRWQTAINIVLPTASPGIFSSVMIGFGRAVGETMIVVMATGNTPLKDFNIFSGMRTLSANIAVELPEAPYHGTLYRTLFLGALVLFVMTFVVNTVAEVLRDQLKDRYKTGE